ncbi:MAG: SDR family oxidoreductase [Bacteroidota bacterium]
MSYFTNKVVWITGASSGIGEALVYEFAHRGARLILSSRRKEVLERVKGNCPAASQANIRVLPLDLAQAETLQLCTEAAIQIFGHIDVLINNGGISQRSLAKDTLLDVDRRIMEIDYFGTIAVSKYLLPHFIQRKSGHFATITSVTGIVGTPYRTGYAAAKHALHGFFDSLRAEVWKDNIHVTLFLPGYVQTSISLNALAGDGAKHNQMDTTTSKGLLPAYVARKMADAIQSKKQEVYIAGARETLAIYLKRWVPGIFSRILRNATVK